MNQQVAMIRREVSRSLAGIRQGLRAVLASLTLDTRVQRVTGEGLADEELDDMELFQHFGFTSAPPKGTEFVLLPLGGRTSASVAIATEHGAYRFILDAQGEMAVYNQWGDSVHLKQDRSIHVVAELKVVMDTPLLQVNGEIKATGNITSELDVRDQGGLKSMRGMREVYNGHHHNETGAVTQTPNEQT